ncbi:MAG TPA: bifunctional 4-hydroxy-2-oxoglutarate aldolase/2-dehydro-3-deoxy-phosphogluconate aldolase [Acidobacteriaceae bacterium]|nr:bifunctional 4-hydroxy-2-oxoglutarate aldolase/2-dehydro-3-deoxy-phosphogluconate aldolase [Acidobacteriaceae bacterium]
MIIAEGIAIPWSKEKALALIREVAVIPVVRVSTREQAICAVDGIISAGITVVEITLTVPGAIQIVQDLTAKYGQKLLVGAGTVLDAETCRLAVLAGAEFIVSPAFDARVLEVARTYGKICMPGALTPTEALVAWQAGADLVKIFPCNSVGGPSYIRSLKGPFPQMEVVVTGGVNLENVGQYLAAGVAAVGVGEIILEREAIEAANVGQITVNARRFVDAIKAARSKA